MADLNDVIKVLIAEGIGEGPEGMRRIGEVILNRAAITGKTPEQIVREGGQFTGYQHPGSATRRAMSDPASVAKATAAWNLALEPGDPTNGANFYHTDAVNPSWDNNMTNKGQYGSHVFYADRPIPPGEIPTVASLTDTVPPRAVAPVTPSIDMAQMRRSTAPSRLVADSFAALPKRGGQTSGDSLALKPVFANFPQAGEWDGGYSPSNGAVTLNNAPATRTLLPPVPPSRLASAAPTPATQSVDLRQSRLPLPNSTPIAPATRSVASVPIPQSQSLPPLSAAPRPAATAFVPEARYIEPRNLVQQSQYIGPFVPGSQTAPSDRLPSTPMAGRLAAPPTVTFDRTYSPAEVNGTVGQTIRPTGPIAPFPRPTIARAQVPAPVSAPAVATQLDVTPPRVAPIPASAQARDIARNGSWNGNVFTPPQRPITSAELTAAIPSLPRPRPNFGMGGVDIPAQLTRSGVAAPTPMPRLQRGGIFGNPQIMGHDVPLPGVFGLLQGATKAINNASGPFNNGGDNALYNIMRGGDFNTPGAATVQGRDGYLYAPKPGGGFINVGRTNRTLSPAQTSAAANQGLFQNGGNGTGSGGSSGGLNTVFDRAFGEARNHN